MLFLDIEPQYSRFDSSKMIVIPVPYEKTTSYGKGAKNGPAAILKASQMVEDYDIELGYEPYKKLGICVLPPVKFSKDPNKDIYSAVKKVLSKNKIPVLLGGEHSISFGAVKAAKEFYPGISVLQFDAHSDLRDTYHGSRFNHACVMRRVREICSAVQVGIRSQDIEEAKYLKEKALLGSVFYAESYDETQIPTIVKQLSKDVYITIDVDVFDPSIMPATGTPEPGGLNWKQMIEILRHVIASKNIVGFDIVELSPKPNMHYAEFTAAKLAYKIMGYISRKI